MHLVLTILQTSNKRDFIRFVEAFFDHNCSDQPDQTDGLIGDLADARHDGAFSFAIS